MSDINSPIPAALHDLLTIFAEHLRDVRFGDIDKSSLEEGAARVLVAAQAADEAQAALEVARAALAAEQQSLLATGQRALAYARIYAEGSPDVFARLQAVSLGHGTAPLRTHEVETKVARRRARKGSDDEMPALPGTVNEPTDVTLAMSA